jgi:hypothetical protein
MPTPGQEPAWVSDERKRMADETHRRLFATIPLVDPLRALFGAAAPAPAPARTLPTPTMAQRLALWADDPDEARQRRANEILVTSEADVVGRENDYFLDGLEAEAERAAAGRDGEGEG